MNFSLARLGWRKNKPQRSGTGLLPLEMFNSEGKTSIVKSLEIIWLLSKTIPF